MFSNPNEFVVYLQVNSPRLRKVWWKPEYSIREYGFNPHLSLYRGPDANLARILEQFLKHEELEILTSEFRIVRQVSKQVPIDDLPRTKWPEVEMLIGGHVRPNLLARLQTVVERYHRRTASPEFSSPRT